MSTISIVIPAYNEEPGIVEFHNKLLIPSLAKIKHKHEIIYVNDGSKDNTLSKLQSLAQKDKNVKVISLSKNFGKEIATTAGIHSSTGDAVMILDADGQHPPKLIPKFIEKWEEGQQVVIGVRNKQKHEGLVKEFGSKIFYRIFNSTSGEEIKPRSTDFRLIDIEVKEAFCEMTERNRITRGLIDWLGFDKHYIHFDSPERLAGEASYSTKQLFKLAMNSFISLSLKPLFLFGYLGLAIVLVSGLAGLFIIIEQLILNDPMGLNITGSAMLGVLLSFFVGLILISQSMLAIYIARIHEQSQKRPLFIVNKRNSRNL